MQKVFIRGVKGRGEEVIAKLEALGGKNAYGLSCEDKNCMYYIDFYGNITASCDTFENTIISWSGTEIFLDEPIEGSKLTLKKNDLVMVSIDGIEWISALYYIDNRVYYCARKGDVNPLTEAYNYIVPYTDFDFNNLESNIKRSIV